MMVCNVFNEIFFKNRFPIIAPANALATATIIIAYGISVISLVLEKYIGSLVRSTTQAIAIPVAINDSLLRLTCAKKAVLSAP